LSLIISPKIEEVMTVNIEKKLDIAAASATIAHRSSLIAHRSSLIAHID
jgi:hypothetical protein